MKWNVISDSSCEIFELEEKHENIDFATVPFVISVGDKDYIDDETLDVEDMMECMKESDEVTRTSCPSTGAWTDQFENEGNTIAITITSGLSGSYNSACAAREMVLEDNPEKKLAIIDSRTAGAGLVLITRKICEMIDIGKEFDAVVECTKEYVSKMHTVFALSSFDNLVKNGRMNRIAGFVANKLGFIGIGIACEGVIKIKGIARGKKKALAVIINDVKEKVGNLKDVVISNCLNEEFAQSVKEELLKYWPTANITIIPTRGLCSYYAEANGLIIGYTVE